jgi:hypothetical protein
MEDLDAAVTKLVRARLEAASARMAAAVRPTLAEFDLAKGMAGLGAYLLYRDSTGCLIRQVLTYLVRLTEPLPAEDQAGVRAPGWWTDDVPAGEPAGAFHGGYADLGMAHGIAGPLALLALSMLQGVTVKGQAVAIDRICRWLDLWRHDGPAGSCWPERVTYAELVTGRSICDGPARPSWCYGTPGLARAQQLAGLATGDLARQQLAEDALVSCLTNPAQLSRFTDPALCHGRAGLIATAWHAAADSRSSEIACHLSRLFDTFFEHAEDVDSLSMRRPGLIEGSAGVALTLHSIAFGTSSGWERSLLIN